MPPTAPRFSPLSASPGATERRHWTRQACIAGILASSIAFAPGRALAERPAVAPVASTVAEPAGAAPRINSPGEKALVPSAPVVGGPAVATERPLRWLEWSLIAAGGLALGGAVVTGAFAAKQTSTPDDGCSDAQRRMGEGMPCIGAAGSTLRTSRRLQNATDVLGLVGLVSLGVGTTLLVMDDDSDDALMDSASVDAACGTHGCAIGLSGKF